MLSSVPSLSGCWTLSDLPTKPATKKLAARHLRPMASTRQVCLFKSLQLRLLTHLWESQPAGGPGLSSQGHRSPQADAIDALGSILSDLGIPVDQHALSFETDPVAQGTFLTTFERVTGSDLGWRTLVQIYEREKQRVDY